MRRRHLFAAIGILLIFALALTAYFAWSAGLPDGLEKVMEDQGASESDPVYHAPLDYGSDYLTMLLMGIIGFAVVLIATYLLLRIGRAKAGTTRKRDGQ
ncbi:MAG: hypothetical protein LUO79_06750 [Methanomassiliicoccales archaeon]|nr:hypothetical protein [Methanomassiliicoccales archaeon]